jgi:lambda repressor-like predicted transcriptional regulator
MTLKQTIKKEIKEAGLSMQKVSLAMGHSISYINNELSKNRENEFLLKRVRETLKKVE